MPSKAQWHGKPDSRASISTGRLTGGRTTLASFAYSNAQATAMPTTSNGRLQMRHGQRFRPSSREGGVNYDFTTEHRKEHRKLNIGIK
jgi:hypothetical protein